MRDIATHNQTAWDAESAGGDSPWCVPVDATTVAAARQGHWDLLLPARAVENQCFVVGVNRVGRDPHVGYAGGGPR